MKLLFSALIIFGLFVALSTRAATSANIIVKVAPENPAPYENTTIILSSYAYNLDTVMITWLVNGQNVASEIGKKSLSVTTGASGSTTTVIAKMDFPDGATETRVVLRPAEMVLLYEAMDSYVPPFYKGKALPVADSEIKVVAMPSIKSGASFLNSKNMTYSWKRDYTNNQADSGYGKNYFTYVNDYLEDLSNISVTASSVDGKYSSEGSTKVGVVTPQISFYRKDSAFGTMWEKTIESGYVIPGSDILIAAPYFISPERINTPILKFNWYLNGNLISTPDYNKHLLPLATQEGATGTSRVGLKIENQYKIFQAASKEIKVEF